MEWHTQGEQVHRSWSSQALKYGTEVGKRGSSIGVGMAGENQLMTAVFLEGRFFYIVWCINTHCGYSSQALMINLIRSVYQAYHIISFSRNNREDEYLEQKFAGAALGFSVDVYLLSALHDLAVHWSNTA